MDAVQNAQRESLYRDVNERVVELSRSFRLERMEVLCECGRGCLERLELTPEAYRDVRADATAFVVVPGHEDDDVESVVGRGDGYYVVAKEGLAAEVARRTFAARG